MPKWNQYKINMQSFWLFLLVVELHYEVTAVTENVLFAEPSDDQPDN